ncbi:MAG: SF1B family DNA helicase RecD2, partial [Chloroflexota bacterium]
IGPVTAARIVDHFGDQSLQVLDEEPERLTSVAGISSKRLDVITASWDERREIRSLMMFLQQHGISTGLASRLFDTYGHRAVAAIEQDPYQLAHDVHGIGFRTADALAGHLGVSTKSLSRYLAGLRYCLSQAADEGHVYLPKEELLARGADLLDASPPVLEVALLELSRLDVARLDGDDVYLAPMYVAETGIAQLLSRLRDTASVILLDSAFDAGAAMRRAAEQQGIELAPEQFRAAEESLVEKFSILTGGPGTGKTSTLRTIITALEESEIEFVLCAPTGRAAKRVAEATGRAASTIHRLLEFQPSDGSFARNVEDPLQTDFVIVDEVSMLDTILCYHLLKAVPPEAHLLFVGDADQLPAVGPGSVLNDLISSGGVPTTTLTSLFRQARNSKIVLAAHAINQGKVPEIAGNDGDDLYFLRSNEPDRVLAGIKQLVSERIPLRFGLDRIDDVQVISPMHGGLLGVTNLNRELQSLLNPGGNDKELRRGDRVFRRGDKVMQIKNNYDKDVFNGDIGRVTDVDLDKRALTVAFPAPGTKLKVEYREADLVELVLAYAISVHKGQGSEFPAVVMPMSPMHFVMLQRNLLYTAITRARLLCVLAGSPRALAIAVRSNPGTKRYSRLRDRITSRPRDLELDLS